MPTRPPRRRQVLGPPAWGWRRPRHPRQLPRRVPSRRHPARRDPMGFRAMPDPMVACIRIFLARTVSPPGLPPLHPRRRSVPHRTGFRPMPARTAVCIRFCSAQKTTRRRHRMRPRRLRLPDQPHRPPTNRTGKPHGACASCETCGAARRVDPSVGRAARNLLRSDMARRAALRPAPLGSRPAGITP